MLGDFLASFVIMLFGLIFWAIGTINLYNSIWPYLPGDKRNPVWPPRQPDFKYGILSSGVAFLLIGVVVLYWL